jgi:5-methyltetrahydropteroyltriglutamate--homocysteine methyltransferase
LRHSTDRILVSHAGNLPLPPEAEQLIVDGELEAYNKLLPESTEWIIDRQIELGVDVVNDGEFVKAGSYGGYIQPRIQGFENLEVPRAPKRAAAGERDRREFPGFYASGLWYAGSGFSGGRVRPGFAAPGAIRDTASRRVATGPIKYIAHEAAKEDVARFKQALKGKQVEDAFISALGPLSLGAGVHNDYYKTEAEYMMAVAEAVREEYRSITDGGFIVQIDEPNFFTSWMFYPDDTVEEYRKRLDFMIEIINHSLEGIPFEQIRFHSCWGSGHRPHVNDIELKYVADKLLQINAKAYSIEAGNVRHEHEWKVWEDVKIPEGRIYMPGVISHATDLVEHPEVVADRLVKYANVWGKENVQTNTDCGIGSRVGHEEVVWAKLKTMSAGAALASKILWGR